MGYPSGVRVLGTLREAAIAAPVVDQSPCREGVFGAMRLALPKTGSHHG
jgi:hypothetical protein